MSHDARLILVAVLGVALLVILAAGFRLHAFVALAVASLAVGLGSGMPPADIVRAFQEGIGATLGLIVVVVGLGAMLGKMLAESGGATVIAETLVRSLGRNRVPWAVFLAAFLVALPVFFAVGLVLLAPVVFGLARTTGTPMLRLALPLLAGLSVCHTLVPPHPGPVVAVGQLHADMGATILWGIAVGLPTAALTGPLLARRLERWMEFPAVEFTARRDAAPPPLGLPAWGTSIFTILSPVLLMLVATASDLTFSGSHPWKPWASFIGSPLVAMLAACVLSMLTFGRWRGFTSHQILRFTEECIGPTAAIFLVVGAGGGFSRVLDAAGVDDVLARWGRELALSPLLLGWLVAAALRIAVGSATVAITMASAIVAPVAAAHPETRPELLVVALGAGTLTLSHLNDGGFWFVKEYFGLTVGQTFRSWTLMVTMASVVALVLVLGLDALLRHL